MKAEIKKEVYSIFNKSFGYDIEDIEEKETLKYDLALDSLDILALEMELETYFGPLPNLDELCCNPKTTVGDLLDFLCKAKS